MDILEKERILSNRIRATVNILNTVSKKKDKRIPLLIADIVRHVSDRIKLRRTIDARLVKDPKWALWVRLAKSITGEKPDLKGTFKDRKPRHDDKQFMARNKKRR